MCTTGTQTDPVPTFAENDALKKENERLSAALSDATSLLAKRVLSGKQLEGRDDLTRFYTGFPTFGSFNAFVHYLSGKAQRLKTWNGKDTSCRSGASHSGPRPWRQMSIHDQVVAVLARLRLGVPALDICTRMGISEASYSRLFATFIPFLAAELKLLFPFPSREKLQFWMPCSFRERFPNTRVIIDCFELQCHCPTGLMNQSVTYSDYKSRNTFKVLLGCTPSGLVSFVSDVFGGRISDQDITMRSGLIDLLESGDMIMADRGFEIQEAIAHKGIAVNVPPCLGKRKQMSALDVKRTR